MKREINYVRFKITFWSKIRNNKELVVTSYPFETSIIGKDLEEMLYIHEKMGVIGRLKDFLDSHNFERYKISDFNIICRQGYTMYKIN